MAIFRIHKATNFTTINNYLIRDKNLSLKDKGMMMILLSLPNNWEYSVKGLEKICKEARNTINSILNNLEKYEYLERRKVYENGKIKEWRYDIYEIPKSLYRKIEDIENEDIDFEAQLNKEELNKEELNITTTDIENTIYDFLQENGFVLAPIHYEIINTWNDDELTRYAIKKAVLNNKYNINYVDKILNSYKKENITSVEQAIESDEEFNKKRESYYKNKYTQKETRYEREQRIMKEWLEKDD